MYLENFVEQVPNVLGEYTSTVSDTIDPELLFGGTLVGASFLIFALIFLFCLVLAIGSYVYGAITLKKIAEKRGIENSWYAWVPIMNTVLMLKIAGLSEYYVIAFIVPLVSVMFIGVLSAIPVLGILVSIIHYGYIALLNIFGIYVYMMMCEKCGKDKWLGLLKIVPMGSYVLLGILAWGKED